MKHLFRSVDVPRPKSPERSNGSGSPAAPRVRSACGERRRSSRAARDDSNRGDAQDATPVRRGLHVKMRARRRQVQPDVRQPCYISEKRSRKTEKATASPIAALSQGTCAPG